MPPGAAAYPPKASALRGVCLRISLRAASTAPASLNGMRSSVPMPLPRTPEISIDLQRDAVLRNEARFQPGLAAEPDHRHAAAREFLRHGDAGEDVSAGAASHDQHGRIRVHARAPFSKASGFTICASAGSARVTS